MSNKRPNTQGRWILLITGVLSSPFILAIFAGFLPEPTRKVDTPPVTGVVKKPIKPIDVPSQSPEVASPQKQNSRRRFTKKGYVAAYNKEDLEAVLRYAGRKDSEGFGRMIESQTVILLDGGDEVDLEGCEDLICSVVKIRLVKSGTILYVAAEAID